MKTLRIFPCEGCGKDIAVWEGKGAGRNPTHVKVNGSWQRVETEVVSVRRKNCKRCTKDKKRR